MTVEKNLLLGAFTARKASDLPAQIEDVLSLFPRFSATEAMLLSRQQCHLRRGCAEMYFASRRRLHEWRDCCR
jgi:ABC-type branched-subunit amino acid transport system ATPase component